MKRKSIIRPLFLFSTLFLITFITYKYTQPVSAAFFGAIYTTLGDGMTVNQNLYDSKNIVYLNGGPQNTNANGLPVGRYYFQVTDPSGATLLSTDDAVCRQLEVTLGTGGTGVISGASLASPAICRHADGTLNPTNGGSIPVQLIPFADTPNNGGEYKVWLIRQATTTTIDTNDPKVIHFTNNNSKTDNFKVRENCIDNPNLPICFPNPPDVFLSGHKFYDANANSLNDDGQSVAGIRIVVAITTPVGPLPPVTYTTDSNGDWISGPIPAGSSYVVSENLPCIDDNNDMVCDVGSYWVQTAPVPDGMGFQGYSGTANNNVTGLDFGDICFHRAVGGYTLGFWSNKNGQKVMSTGGPNGINNTVYPVFGSTDVPPNPMPGADGTGTTRDLMFLTRLNLKESSTSRRFPNGDNYDPANSDNFREWLLNGNAVNMSYMLSVQLSATSLNVRHRFLSDGQIVDARNVCNSLGSCFGFETIGGIRVLSNESLNNHSLTVSGDPWRDSQEQMKNFLDGVNNNRLAFASATACSVFYPPPPPFSDKSEQ